MAILKRAALAGVVVIMLPFVLGNKGCQNGTTWEHPQVSRGADCTECHDESYGIDKKPTWHDAAFSREHGESMARFGYSNKNSCILCHAQADCSSCHQQNPPQSHTNFFRLRGHGLQLALDRTRCQTCHQTDFCQRCHASTAPLSHTAGWGNPGNRHCLGCHAPATSAGAQGCAVCHMSTPSHNFAPPQPTNGIHIPGANCKNIGCHTPLRHPDNGNACVSCHPT